MGITALVSLEDATRNLSQNTYSVILHKSLVKQELLVSLTKPSRLMIGVSSLQKMSLLIQQIIRAIAPISLLFMIAAGKPIWLRIFAWNYPNHPYIVASADRPIYDVQNRFLGMVAGDIHLLSKNMVANWNVFLLLVKEVS